MKEVFTQLMGEIKTLLQTRITFLLLGMGMGSGGDVQSIISLVRSFIGM